MSKNIRCAPGITFDNDSCIPLDILIEMVKAYNEDNPNNLIKLHPSFETLNRSKYKKYLLKNLDKKLKNKCTDQLCWTKQSFIKKMKEKQRNKLLMKTFRPKGPNVGFEWLNTININDVMNQYEDVYKEFKFLGAVPIDFDDLSYLNIKNLDFTDLLNSNINKIGIIFNLDESYKSGSHWVAAYSDLIKGQVYYYDSYGIEPEHRIRKFLRRIANYCKNTLKNNNIVATHNKIRHQFEGSECGVYSINFILRLLKGHDFQQICNDKTPDKVINKCRKIYFNK